MDLTRKSLFCMIIILSLCSGCEQEPVIQSAKADSADERVRENPFSGSLNKSQEQQTVPTEPPPINGGPLKYRASTTPLGL